MTVRRALAALLAVGALAAPSAARGQTFTVDPVGAPPPAALARAEAAVSAEAGLLSRYWGTPPATWGPNGWRVEFVRRMPRVVGCYDASACHAAGPFSGLGDFSHPGPVIVIGPDPQWTVDLSHEVLETLVDPATTYSLGGPPEVCDPVETAVFRLPWNRSVLQDFATPAFYLGGPGPYDLLGLVKRPHARWPVQIGVPTWPAPAPVLWRERPRLG